MEIAEKFGLYFAGICTTSTEYNDLASLRLIEELEKYNGQSLITADDIDTNMVDDIVCGMKRGKALDIDELSAEHIQFSHPSIIILLRKLFNCMLRYGISPQNFGKGLTIPILKAGNSNDPVKYDNFRGITISPIISKIFEHCILLIYKEHLSSSDSQFGFKKGMGCSEAIFAVKNICDYYSRGNSTVNLCTIDISKAFDKVNYFTLISKLVSRRLPRPLLNLLFKWLTNSYCVVKWNGVFSSWFKLNAGVRQGGVLSPSLFAVYVDDLLKKLSKCKLGCFIKTQICNAFMYADDLILISASLCHLQKMINICTAELTEINLSVNSKKCALIRIGRRAAASCCPLYISGNVLSSTSEFRYLGVFMKTGNTLKFNFDHAKQKFYMAANGILAKTGNKPEIVLSLINAFGIPLLLYGTESMGLTKSEKSRINLPYFRLFGKLFHTFDISVLAYCQYYMGCLPLNYIIDMRLFKLLIKISHSDNIILKSIFRVHGQSVLKNLCTNYNIACDSSQLLKRNMWNAFIVLNELSVS